MYGLVNRAIQQLLVTEHGHDVWLRVARRADCEGVEFVGLEPYDDAITYGLVQAASEELGASVPELLEAFGGYWMRFTAEEGFGPLLDMGGDTFAEFLGNLDELHARIALTYPELRPPSFELVSASEGDWSLRYRSERSGLAPMVVGLLKALAARFELDVEVHLEPVESDQQQEFVFRIRAAAADERSAA